MDKNDNFGNWLKSTLEEESKGISFTPEAREKVKNRIMLHDQDSREQVQKQHWWRKEVSLSLRAVSFCVVILFIVAAFYTRTFFYVSSAQIAKFETREKVILHDDRTPFGALQHLVASLENGKGVGRP